MRVCDRVSCPDFPCGDVDHGRHEVPAAQLDSARVRLILVAEAPPAAAADGLHAPGLPFHLATTLQAFREAGAAASAREDLDALGVYLTTAVKCAKTGAVISRATTDSCSRLLGDEIGLFPEARVIMLMGDVAIAAGNAVARRSGRGRLIPSGPLWRVRRGEYSYEDRRVFPTYLQTGKSYLIERSKREMIATDLAAALALLGN